MLIRLRLSFHRALTCLLFSAALVSPGLSAQTDTPAWCRALPRPAYQGLHQTPVSDSWFRVYQVAQGVFAIYEPHQSEETISYFILGHTRAMLFDTGMGIGNLRNVTRRITSLPVVVLNSHTHNDHVGDNWQFDTVYSMDTDFSRKNAQGSREDAQAEVQDGQICGILPIGFDRAAYVTRPWKIAAWVHDGDRIDLGGRSLAILSTPGHTPDSICLFDQANGLLFTGDTFYPGTIWLYRPETDLAAYDASVRRLAALAPQVRLVLGAHNVPFAPPTVLPQLVAAFESVTTGKVPAAPAGPGKIIYQVGEISFLMKAPDAATHPPQPTPHP